MPVFLNQERTKIGTTTGTLIAFPQELEVNDPAVGNSAELLPAGYLRCDGGIYSEEIYPALAQVLGTGEECSFKQEGVTLGDNQFQVPDLRSKFIRASSASDQGVINDNTVVSATGQTIERSGVGVSVSSNVGSVANVDLVGQFRIPPRTVNLTGNVGFTRPRRVDEEVVPANAFLPHMHYSTTFRSRTIRRQGNAIFEFNFFQNTSTIGVVNWFDATDSGDNGRQPACKHYAQQLKWETGTYIPGGGFLSTSYEYYGICKSGCSDFIRSCLIPTGRTIDVNTTPEGISYQNIPLIGRRRFTPPGTNEVLPANYILGGTGVGLDDIPTSAGGASGALQSFKLYESIEESTDYTGAGYYNKGVGQWAYTAFGGSTIWTGLDDFAQQEVDLVGGSGTGLRVFVRLEAWPGVGGLPSNTRYKVVGIVDAGQNYVVGDVLTFPDVQGKSISGAPSTGSGGISLEIITTSFANIEDAAAYPHEQSLHNVLPVDTFASNSDTIAYPQVSNIVETTNAFNYEEDPTRHSHTIDYTTGLTNYEIDIPETFISTDGMSASISIQTETDTKIDSLISPFAMVDYLIKT